MAVPTHSPRFYSCLKLLLLGLSSLLLKMYFWMLTSLTRQSWNVIQKKRSLLWTSRLGITNKLVFPWPLYVCTSKTKYSFMTEYIWPANHSCISAQSRSQFEDRQRVWISETDRPLTKVIGARSPACTEVRRMSVANARTPSSYGQWNYRAHACFVFTRRETALFSAVASPEADEAWVLFYV